MGNLPVVHEVSTSFMSLGDAITGHPERARERWNNYAEQSVIGSGIYAAVEASCGNLERAEELGKGMGRATGSALLGGGLLRNVPGFQELATAGDALGDVIGGGDTVAAAKRWDDYAENSVIGTGVYAAVEAGKGNMERARELGENMGKAALSGAVTVAAVGASVATGGLAAPFGAAASAGVGAVVGAATGAGVTAAEQAIKGEEIRGGDVLGSALMGGVGGAVGGAMKGRAAAKTRPSTASTRPSTASMRPITASKRPSTAITRPSTASTRPSTASTRPSTADIKPSTASTRPSTASTRPSTTDTTPSTDITRPSTASTRPSTDITRLSTASTRPSTADIKPSTASTRPSTASTRPSTASTRPSTASTRPSTASTRPSTTDTRPSTDITRPSTASTRPSTASTRPSTADTRPSTDITRPSTASTRPSTASTRPSTADTRPSTADTRPSTDITRPSTASTRPSTASTRPSTADTRPSTDITRPSTASTRPSTDITRPSTASTRPTTASTEPNTSSTGPNTAKISVKEAVWGQNAEGFSIDTKAAHHVLHTIVEEAPQVTPQLAAANKPGGDSRHKPQARKATANKGRGTGAKPTKGSQGVSGGGQGVSGGGQGVSGGGQGVSGGGQGGRGGGQGGRGGGKESGKGDGKEQRKKRNWFIYLLGMTEEQFNHTFQIIDEENGVYVIIAPEGINFVHAFVTTGDKPTNLVTGQSAQSAGELWRRGTGSPISESPCCVTNCTNPACNGQTQQVAAHVYLTSQSQASPIQYMMLIPTCSACNNTWQSHNNNTTYPRDGQSVQTANPLNARPGTKVIFIRIDDNTAGRKGAGKGNGKGGSSGGGNSKGGSST